MTETDPPTCEYIATAEDESVGHTDTEEIEGNVVHCTADADTVVRPKGRSLKLNNPRRQKKVVCTAHGRYLTKDDPDTRPDNCRLWELDAMDPETVVGVGCE